VEEELLEALDPIPVERVVEALETIAAAADKLLAVGLRRDALIKLIQLSADARIRKDEIETVLEALPRLRDLIER
jgi:hypothetical protein